MADFRQGLWDAARRRKHCILATIYSGKTTAFGQGRITAREPRFTCFDSGRPTRPGKNIAVHVGPSISSSPLFASLPLVRPPDFLFLRLRREAHITCVTRLALAWFLMRTYLGWLCASQPSRLRGRARARPKGAPICYEVLALVARWPCMPSREYIAESPIHCRPPPRVLVHRRVIFFIINK